MTVTGMTKPRILKRRGGRIGSGARRSCRMVRTISTTVTMKSPMIIGELHGYAVPPQLRQRSRQIVASAEKHGAGVVDAMGRTAGWDV